MRELAFLNKGLKINLIDETHAKTKLYENKYDGGIAEFVTFLDQKKSLLICPTPGAKRTAHKKRPPLVPP